MKFLTCLHESLQEIPNIEDEDEDIKMDDIMQHSNQYIPAIDYKAKREWFWDEILQKHYACINVLNTISTDAFPCVHPAPCKSFMQWFAHIFAPGLDQL